MSTGITLPVMVEDNMTKIRYTVTEITDTAGERYYWIDGKKFKASRFSVLKP